LITSLEAEFRNFLYEAKNFIRDTLKAFYGTAFDEASNYYLPVTPKNGKQSLVGFAESTFGPNDPKTDFLSKCCRRSNMS
jgi:hypothetical protein